MNKEKLDREIVRMKKLIATLVREENKNLIGVVEKYNQRVVLAVANFRCQNQKCLSEENLQIHHLIMRKAKDFMDFWRYASQRYYWANQIVLCQKCHSKYHGFMGKDTEPTLCITKKRIDEIKKFFGVKSEEEIEEENKLFQT